MILSLSFKNIWRNRVRSLVVIMAMTVGLTGGIMAVAMMQGMVNQKIESTIYTEVSHIQVHQPGFVQNPEISEFMPNADSIALFARENSNVLAVSRRLKAPVMINSPRVSTGVNLIGVDPKDETAVSELFKNMCDSCGNYLEEGKTNQILISKRIADRLKIKLRSKVVVTMQDTAGNLTGAAFRVCGIFKTFNAPFDEGNAFILNSDFRRLTLMPESASHEITMILKSNEALLDVKEQLQQQFPNQTVRTWKDIQPENAMMSEWMAVMNYFIVGIILLTLGFGILNTMLMAVLDRIKEIGMLIAIGMARARVFSMIMLETIMLSLIGGAGGVILSLSLLKMFETNGFDFSMYSDAFERMGYPSVIYPTIPTEFFVGLTILVLLTGIISAIYPARKAIKLKPIEAIRTDT
jgi:ABC-type lipoprotein release transport system permease subunit